MLSLMFPPPRVVGGDVLYVDYDGCLHCEDVHHSVRRGIYVKSPPGHELFENADLLAQLLEPYPSVRIVLSTTWARTMGYAAARSYLPAALQARCVGGTFHNGVPRDMWAQMARGEQVRADVTRRRPARWLAIDDDPEGWGGSPNFIQTDPVWGIREPGCLARLQEALERFKD